MKHHLTAILTLLLCASALAACGDSDTPATQQTGTAPTAADTAAPEIPTNEAAVRA